MKRIIRAKEIEAIYNQCLKKALKKKRLCFVNKCEEFAINSHILWKAGILKPISTDSKLIELNVIPKKQNEKAKFAPMGLKKILSFKGFCSYHDNEIFQHIENFETDYSLLKNQILLSVRGVFHEKRKKEELIDWFKNVLNERILTKDQENNFRAQIYVQQLGIQDLNFYISELNKEYIEPTGRFIFKYFELQKTPIVTSSVFHTDSIDKMNFDRLANENWEDIPLNTILFNFFPYKEKSIIIFGFHSYYLKENLDIINKITNYDDADLLNLVSNVLIERVESWACSFDFYNNYLKENESKILADFAKESSDFNGRLGKSINIFEHWN